MQDRRSHTTSRRTVLRLSAASLAAGSLGAATANATGNGRQGPPDHAGPKHDRISIDYDEFDEPGDVYNVNDNRSDIPPTFVSEPTSSGESALAMEFADVSKTANVEYRFPEHANLNGRNEHGMPEELWVRFKLYPEDIELSSATTVRFFWLPLTNGDGSSGGGAPDGTNGFSNAIGFANRNDSPAPDGYNFFSYAYHMDGSGQGEGGVDFEMTDVPVWMDQWNDIRGYVRCNTFDEGTANFDGVMRYWVNGQLAYQRTGMRFTTSPGNLIEGTGPLGYVVGDDLSGSRLVYDDHEMEIGYNPRRQTGKRQDTEKRIDEDEEDEVVEVGTVHQFRDLLEEASTDYRDDFDVAIQLQADEAGEEWSFSFDAAHAEEYEVGIEALFVGSYGIYELYVNDEFVDEIDFYDDNSEWQRIWYNLELQEGKNTMSFVNVGRNADASNYRMALEHLILLDQDAQDELS